MYRVRLTSRAKHELDKLSSQDFERISAALVRIKTEPRPSGVKKLREYIWRIRVGDWRIIYTIMDKDNLVIVGKIARRSEDTYNNIDELF